MVNILSHIGHVVEAPMLDAYSNEGGERTYFAVVADGMSFRKEDVQNPQVGDEINILPVAPGATLAAISTPIHLVAGQKIVYGNHAAAHGVYVLNDNMRATCVAIAGAYSTIEYTSPTDADVVLACSSGMTEDHTYTIITPADISTHIKYLAHLIDEESGKKTRDVECQYKRIDEDGDDTNENTLIYFPFEPHDFLDFEDRAKLSIYVYTDSFEEAWWAKKAYRFLKTKISCGNE